MKEARSRIVEGTGRTGHARVKPPAAAGPATFLTLVAAIYCVTALPSAAGEDAERERAAAEAAKREATEKEKAEDILPRWEEPEVTKQELRQITEAMIHEKRLGVSERRRLQVALTATGFDTRGTDGTFGPRTREMIGSWQRARGMRGTGFLTPAQKELLLKEGSAAVTAFDEAEGAEALGPKQKAAPKQN